MPKMAIKIDGNKFMWDKGNYSCEEEAKEKIDRYNKDGFEIRLVKEEDRFLVYTRKVITKIVLEGGGPLL